MSRWRAILWGVLVWLACSRTARAKPSLAVEPFESLSPAPAASVGNAWMTALQAQGARVPEEFVATVSALHPLQTGTWSSPFFAHVVGMGSAVSLTGTVVVEALGPAETRVHMEPRGKMGPPEVLAWNRLVKKARQDAKTGLAGATTTPGEVLSKVAAELSDPDRCEDHLHHLAAVGTSEAARVVESVEADIAASCRPASVALVAKASEDPLLWAAWFRRAWLGADARLQDGLVAVLRDLDDRPADLEFLMADISAREKVDAWVREQQQQAQDRAPVRCADGSIDAQCSCGDPHHRCCVHHGGFDQCLQPESP